VSPLRLQEALDVLCFAACRDDCRAAEPALALGSLLREDVALERLEAFDLARPRKLEALSRAPVTLHLRHF
jgi:hypothetical protein